ncbi:BT4734/BF3469 family protein [uncultured Muribaculum sp.]|uniref:BT4734/BF3469 family protein n=2 Tax=uncultured Muribaculum sp. TaxID=1918613 RepID=UPI00266F663B|nr:BT4734/BF3469 family protein [uncultured Muribaculum sp.]
METQTILNKLISFCPNVQAKSYKSISLFEALNSIRIGNYEKQIGNIRRLLTNNNIQSYRAKKKQLPAYIFSGIAFGNRYKFDISGYTSLIVVDIDKLENIELVKSQLKSDCHVISVWMSPSGNGLKALFYVEYASPIKEEDIWVLHEHCAFPQIENYLLTKYSIQVDQTGADITRLCFVSSDSDIHLKREFESFNIDITLTSKQIWNIKRKYYYGRKNVRNAVITMRELSNRSLNSFDTNDGNISQILFHPDSTNELRIPDMCNKLHHVYSRVCIFINCINYESAERLIETAEELITALNEMSKEDDSANIQIKFLTERFLEIGKFLNFLKSIEGKSDKHTESELLTHCPDLNHKKEQAIKNLFKRDKIQNMVMEFKSNINSYDISQRKAWINNMKMSVTKSFRGAGCSSLRKWARQQLADIYIG